MASHPFRARLVLAALLMAGLAGATLAWRLDLPAPPPLQTDEEIPELGVGDMAPDFDLPLISGGRVVLQEVLGERPVLLVVWAVWCPPCVDEFQELQRLHEKYAARGLQILAVGVRYNQSVEDVRLFARNQGVEFPVLYDEYEKVVQRYGVTYIPTNFIINRDGAVEFSAYGLPGDLEERIESLLERA